MRKVFIYFCLFFLSVLWSEELPQIEYHELTVGEAETLEVMTWNIQNFPKTEFTIDYAAKIINAIDADIIGLQEMESDSAFFCLVKQLNDIDDYNWSGYRANRNYWKQELAFIYKTDLIGVNSIYEIFYGDWHAFPHSPLVMECTFADQEIIIINNHFKARTGKKNEDRRREAVQKLDNWISENHAKTNVIVLGDMNDELTDEDSENVFTAILQKPEEYKFADYNIAQNKQEDWSYPYWKYRGHIDHILITNELFGEYEKSSDFVKVITIDKYMEGGDDARYKYITDHRPVVIKLKFDLPEGK